MRVAMLTSEPLDIARGSGTAVAVAAMRESLGTQGAASCVVLPRHRGGVSQTLTSWRYNESLDHASLDRYDAVIGINGDGHRLADQLRTPFITAIKAFYHGALQHEHGMVRSVLGMHARRERAAARAADAVMVPSRWAAESVVAAYGVEPHTVHVVPEPFDAERWRRHLPPLQRGGNRVLCVAHLYPRKRIVDLISAWPLVVEQVRDARLDIAGDGPELRRLSAAAIGLPSCYLHGHVQPDGIRQLHARADVFCLPSAQETFGYAVVEAMASGLPVVVAGSSALSDLTAAAAALRVPPGDVDALAAALISALTDSELRSAAMDRNPAQAALFAPDRVGVQLLGVLRAAQRRAGGRASRRAGSDQYDRTTSRMSSGRPASASAK